MKLDVFRSWVLSLPNAKEFLSVKSNQENSMTFLLHEYYE